MKRFSEIKLLKNLKKVCLVAHRNPDADAIASMLVFKNFLLEKFRIKTVDVFADCEKFPRECLYFASENEINPRMDEYDAVVMMDCPNATEERLGKYLPLFLNTEIKICIDHHSTNLNLGRLNYVEKISSTCEIVFNILEEFNYNFTKQDLIKIYSGIITDTNNFSVGEFGKRSFEIASVCAGEIDTIDVYLNFFSNNTLKNMQVLAKSIENIKNFKNNQIIISHISKVEAKKFNINQQDYIGIINRLKTIANSKFVCFIYPKDNGYYVSLRADKHHNVAVIAQKYGGGGHVGASAFMSFNDISTIEKIIIEEFSAQL